MNSGSIHAVASSIRSLAMDSIQDAGSGHPGLPLGCADFGALLFGEILQHFPGDPNWMNRDRFVLSAGHGSMLLYSLLHLAGYDVTLDDIRSFRRFASRTPGHPEYRKTPGVEVTTGPLGQGVGNAVGMAIAAKMEASRFNTEDVRILDYHVYALASDGDMMEGITYEATSLAGHLGLGNLVLFYDSNGISIDGPVDLAFSEDICRRFDALNWHTASCDGYDLPEIARLVEQAKTITDKPSLIVLQTVIGKGAPNLAGSARAHSSPLGSDEVRNAKKEMGFPEDCTFHIDGEAIRYFAEKREKWEQDYKEWQSRFMMWRTKNPGLYAQWRSFFNAPELMRVDFPTFDIGQKISTREASGRILNRIAKEMPNLVGGSADVGRATATLIDGDQAFSNEEPMGRRIHFGVREHAMAAIANGMALHRWLRVYCGSLLVFSDYMRPSIRLAAMMELPIIYVFTHDSIYVGEDGPTHQPVEHLASLRAIPNLLVLRPGDADETIAAWKMALGRTKGPSALVLSRQQLEVYQKADKEWVKSIEKGGYVVSESAGEPEVVIVATGSEVNLAIKLKQSIPELRVRVLSLISRELFLAQSAEAKRRLIPGSARVILIEAGVSLGWEMFEQQEGCLITIDRFGASGSSDVLAEEYGITVGSVMKRLRESGFLATPVRAR